MPLFSQLHKVDILKLHSSICILPYTSVFLKLEFMFMKQYAPNRCEPSTKKFRSGGGWGHGAYNQRNRVIAKMLKKSWVGRGGGGGGGGCQGGFEQRIEVIVKIAKKS